MTGEWSCRHLAFPSDVALDLARDFRLLFFVGGGRTGSTLFGQILNFHPQCLISNESKFLEQVLRKGAPPEVAFAKMSRAARHQFDHGLEHSSHYSTSMDRYQPRWRPMADLHGAPAFSKQTIAVAGDKKAGGATKLFRKHRERFEAFLAQNSNVHLLQMVRDPAAAASSYLKSHQPATFEEACARVIRDTATAHELSSIGPRYRHLFYEDLLLSPEQRLREICLWLGLSIDEGWIESIVSVIDRTPSNVPADRRSIANRMVAEQGVRILDRYATPAGR